MKNITPYEPMSSAPRDGSEVILGMPSGDEIKARFTDFEWLRKDGENVSDCWQDEDFNDIELDQPIGWRNP